MRLLRQDCPRIGYFVEPMNCTMSEANAIKRIVEPELSDHQSNLVEKHFVLCKRVRMFDTRIDPDELESTAGLALIEAALRYKNPEEEEFAPFAMTVIKR